MAEPDEVKVDKGVPLPKSGKGVPKYPWDDLKVGDSFIIKKCSRVSIAYRNGLGNGKKFVSRTVVENGKKVIRVWRVE